MVHKVKVSRTDRDYKPSVIDPCLNIGKGMIILTYVDNCVIVGPSMTKIDSFVKSIQTGKEQFMLTDKGDIDKFLDIDITQLDAKRFKVTHLFLMDQIISFLGIDTNGYGMNTHPKPTSVGKPLL